MLFVVFFLMTRRKGEFFPPEQTKGATLLKVLQYCTGPEIRGEGIGRLGLLSECEPLTPHRDP